MPNRLQIHAGSLSEPMPSTYRVLLLTESGTVHRIVLLSAEDDDRAIAHAKSMITDYMVELWDGLRFIDQFRPIT